MGLMQDFTQARTERRSEIVALKSETATLCREADDMLKEFRGAHAVMGRELRDDLDKANSALEQAEISRRRTEAEDRAQRRSETETARSNVRDLLKDFDKSRADMSRQLRADLDKADAERKSEVKTLRSDARATLKGFGESHTAMGKELRAHLAKTDAEHKSDTTVMLRGFNKAHAAMSKELGADLDRANRERHAAIWGTTKPIQAKTARPPAARPPERTPDAVLGDQFSKYLANHPDGTRMTELEEKFSIARIHAAKVLRNLMDNNKVEKRDMLYFAL